MAENNTSFANGGHNRYGQTNPFRADYLSLVQSAHDRPLKATHAVIPRDLAHVLADGGGLGTLMGAG
jgi:hypothetical protein